MPTVYSLAMILPFQWDVIRPLLSKSTSCSLQLALLLPGYGLDSKASDLFDYITMMHNHLT